LAIIQCVQNKISIVAMLATAFCLSACCSLKKLNDMDVALFKKSHTNFITYPACQIFKRKEPTGQERMNIHKNQEYCINGDSSAKVYKPRQSAFRRALCLMPVFKKEDLY
jgi:hypothetical protein